MSAVRKAINGIIAPGDVHINAPLTNVAIAYFQNASVFIADKVFPNIPVQKQSDLFWKYIRADWNRGKYKIRAPVTESVGAGFGTERDTYYADVWALHNDISDQTRANADSVFSLDRDATNFLMMQGLISRELSFAAKFLVAGVWGNEATGVASAPGAGEFISWDDAGSTPIEDVRSAKRVIQSTTGFLPNILTLGAAVYDTLIDHPDIVDRIKYGGGPGAPAIINKAALAALFEVDQVLVSEAFTNTSDSDEVNEMVMGNDALLTYSPATASSLMPSAGYTFSWTGYLGASDQGVRVKKFRMEELAADRVEAEMAYEQKMVAPDLGYFFEDAITPPATS
jgi:hypothetical protein